MLSLDGLKASMRHLFTAGSMPAGDAVGAWIRSYTPYAQAALAGGTVPTAPLVAPPASGDFLTALDGALRGMWMSVAWAGPGLIGKTAVVPPVQPFITANFGELLGSRDPERALAAIAQSIHTYTLSITVTVVTATGAATVVTLA